LQKSLFLFFATASFGLFIPPSYLEEKVDVRPRWLDRLNKLEKKAGYSFLFAFAIIIALPSKKPA